MKSGKIIKIIIINNFSSVQSIFQFYIYLFCFRLKVFWYLPQWYSCIYCSHPLPAHLRLQSSVTPALLEMMFTRKFTPFTNRKPSWECEPLGEQREPESRQERKPVYWPSHLLNLFFNFALQNEKRHQVFLFPPTLPCVYVRLIILLHWPKIHTAPTLI